MIKAENLQKTYYLGNIKVPVLQGVDLSIEAGEYVIVTGRSGAGKSTLLYLLSLLDDASGGHIYLSGSAVEQMGEREKAAFRLLNFGYVFQDYALLPELTALENVLLPLLMRGQDRKEAVLRAQEALSQVDLGGKTGNLPSQLSGGQQQRVSIARAIASRPKILFADEPTANLDSQTAIAVMEVFRQLNSEGQTIIMVTHELEKAKGAQRLISLSDGRISVKDRI